MKVRFTPERLLHNAVSVTEKDVWSTYCVCELCGAAIIITGETRAMDPVKRHRRWHEGLADTIGKTAATAQNAANRQQPLGD